jgi:flavin-dependent dehydrogenase
MKILIIGAGEGGLTAAYDFAAYGHDVSLYEKRAEKNLGYDWNDIVGMSVFSDLGIPYSVEEGLAQKRDWEFNAPNSTKWIRIALSQTPSQDFCIPRRPLKELLINRARSAGAKLFFETRVERLIAECTAIKGLVVGGEEIFADLVIDSSGALSVFRACLTSDFGITAMPSSDEIFYAYRGIYARKPGFPISESYVNRGYVRYLGKVGIAWYNIEAETGNIDVMIGESGKLTKDGIKDALEFLMNDNAEMSDTLIRGGITVPIPLRYPASKMVADGYALVGDSAFMTMPIIGSGMAPAMYAGHMLAETVHQKQSASIESLWEYQVKFMNEIGCKHIAIDFFKRWLLTAKDSNLRYLTESGIITDKDIAAAAAAGKAPALSFLDVLNKIITGRDNIPFLLQLSNLLLKSKNGLKLGADIPKTYDKKSVDAWQRKLDKLFK